MNVFFLVFLSLLHFLLSFLQHCVLEGGFYERYDQFSDPYFLLLLVGHSSPTSPCVTLNFSHDRSKWHYSSFSSTTLQNTSEGNSDSPPSRSAQVLFWYLYFILKPSREYYHCAILSTFVTLLRVLLLMPRVLSAPHVTLLLLMPSVLSHSSFTT
jgi:hypothetical protein